MGTVPMAGADVRNVRMNQLDAMESDMPERPQLSGPGASTDQIQISASEKQLNDARQLTRDNPAAVANIIKTWMNGEAAA
jgi:flagellar M-ring protein FliF